jgi:hypothetical protein
VDECKLLQMGHRAEQLREKTRAAQSCVELEASAYTRSLHSSTRGPSGHIANV